MEWLRVHEFWIAAIGIFVMSRVVVAAGARLGEQLVLTAKDVWSPGDAWYLRLLRWDSGWYHGIVVNGYDRNGQLDYATAFYPLYPLASRFVNAMSGVGTWEAMLVVANLSCVAIAVLLAKIARDELKDDQTTLVALGLFWFFPTSFFLSAGYTESLCLMFMLLSFFLLRRGQFVLGALAAGLALATRSTGIVMMPVIAWEMWTQLRHAVPLRVLLVRMAFCGLLGLSGLLAYIAYLGIGYGDPFAFSAAQQHWYDRSMLQRFLSAITFQSLFESSIGNHLGGKISFVCFAILTALSFWRFRFSLVVLGAGVLLLPYLTLDITPSMPRFVILCVPTFFMMALLCDKRPALSAVVTAMFGSLLMLGTALFSQWYWMG